VAFPKGGWLSGEFNRGARGARGNPRENIWRVNSREILSRRVLDALSRSPVFHASRGVVLPIERLASFGSSRRCSESRRRGTLSRININATGESSAAHSASRARAKRLRLRFALALADSDTNPEGIQDALRAASLTMQFQLSRD